MDKLQVEYLSIDELKPYKKNAKIHTEKQVEQIKNSIERFGMNDPIGIWKGNVIIEGHGRMIACQELGFKEVPVIRLDHMTDKERKAYCLAHNKLTMNTDFDFEILSEELDGLFDFDMEDFGFEFVDEEDYKEKTQERVENILNLGIASYEGVGKYDIPELEPVYDEDIGEITEWIGFNYVLSDEEPTGKAVHFFIDDYQFERVFKNPEKYIEKLRRYECVLTPDFSPYGDMPMATQIFNHYKKHWCGAYFQEHGVRVVPTIRCSTDERSLEWYLDGEPEGGVVAYSSMWIKEGTNSYDVAVKEWQGMIEKLNPEKVFLYGKKFDFMEGTIIERVNMHTDKFRA